MKAIQGWSFRPARASASRGWRRRVAWGIVFGAILTGFLQPVHASPGGRAPVGPASGKAYALQVALYDPDLGAVDCADPALRGERLTLCASARALSTLHVPVGRDGATLPFLWRASADEPEGTLRLGEPRTGP